MHFCIFYVVARFNLLVKGGITQLVECMLCMYKVMGSNPITSKVKIIFLVFTLFILFTNIKC